MASRLINRRDIDFILHEFVGIDDLLSRDRFSDHSTSTVSAVLDTAYTIAETHFAPHNRKADENEPRFVDGRAVVIPEVGQALRHFIDAGFLAATADHAWGGLQLPFTVHMASSAVFSAANIGTMGYPFLTMAAANLLRSFGSDEQRQRFMQPMLEGRFFGTMALTEPQAGSSLSDIRTTAVAAGDGSYQLTGAKIFISAGEHDLGENIVHLVLARIKGALPGVKGISLFLVPKFLLDADGRPAERNDVALAGLIHKMGYRGTTSTLLSFGEKGGATGYLVGKPEQGLACMFQMMNEARIGVGSGAAALGYTGYLHALAYARERPQGRPPLAKDPASPQVAIIEHSDVRRMLLTQKAYCEGALALCLYAARLVDDHATAATEQARTEALLLLEVLTPIVKSWPSQWCLEANALAIQVHGGYGYTREYPVEQIYRDNRLNPIHEGTHGIQGLDLLGRKLMLAGGSGFALLCARIEATITQARALPELEPHAQALATVLSRCRSVTAELVATMKAGRGEPVLANASVYLEALGHVVVAWIWLGQAVVAARALASATGEEERCFYQGKLEACRYFMRWELPKTALPFDRLAGLDDTWLAVAPNCL